MTIRAYKNWSNKDLLRVKKDLEFEASNWKRKIVEIKSGIIDVNFYPSVSEYKSRIRDCKNSIKQIDMVLKERGML